MDGFVNSNIFEQKLVHSNRYGYNKIDKNLINQYSESKNETKQYAYSGNISSTINDNLESAVDTVTAPNQDKRQRLKTAGIIGSSVVVVGALTLMLTKGKVSKSLTNVLGKFTDAITKKIDSITKKPTLSKAEGYYLSFLQKTNKAAQRVRGAVFNITPLKDVLFKRFVREKCGLEKPCDAITNFFRKMSFGTVLSAYGKAGKNIDKMTSAFDRANKRIGAWEFTDLRPVPKKETIEKLNEMTGSIRKEFSYSFNPVALEKRKVALTQRFNGLSDKVYDTVYGKIKDFVTDVDEWTTFVPERIIAKDKAQIMESLEAKKRIITNNPADNYKKMTAILEKLDDAIDPQHVKSREIVKKLRYLTFDYSKLSGANEAEARTKLVQELNTSLRDAIRLANTENYDKASSKKISSLVRSFGKVINTDKKGTIEEMMTIYKELLPDKEYKELSKTVQKTVKSLNDAVYNEGFQFVDKERDLSVGSALTDVAIGTAIPVGTTTLAITKAKTKEKKRSVALKYGLPLLAGIATTTISTVRLISGGKALLLGGAVSIISNEVFERLDKYLIKRDKLAAKNISSENGEKA